MFKTIINSKAEILSAMGVIEHLRYPHKLFQAFRKAKLNIYIILSRCSQ